MVSIYMSDSEPTENDLAFLNVPYSRYVPNDEDLLPINLSSLVSDDVADAAVAGCRATRPRVPLGVGCSRLGKSLSVLC